MYYPEEIISVEKILDRSLQSDGWANNSAPQRTRRRHGVGQNPNQGFIPEMGTWPGITGRMRWQVSCNIGLRDSGVRFGLWIEAKCHGHSLAVVIAFVFF